MSLIELKQVTKEYQSKERTVTAVDNINLQIEAGDIFGIIGYSGAGKSSLVRLFNGLEKPTSGTVLVQEKEVATLAPKQLRQFRQNIGMIFQHFNLLWSRTVLENIMLPLELAGVPKAQRLAKAEHLLSLVGLTGKGDSYPSQLSGGQKQRVGIARALANDPEILLCDEATSALDPQTTDEVLDLLLEINRTLGLTIILITHEMHVIRKICNKVAVMEKGKIVESGNAVQIFRHPEQAITKRFVQQETQPTEDATELLHDLIQENPKGLVVNLKFTEENTDEPLISQVIRQFQVEMNIVQAQVQQTKAGLLGNLTVMVTGEPQAVQQALTFFEEQDVELEVIHYEK